MKIFFKFYLVFFLIHYTFQIDFSCEGYKDKFGSKYKGLSVELNCTNKNEIYEVLEINQIT